MSYWINKSVMECLHLGDASKLERTKTGKRRVPKRNGLGARRRYFCFMEKMDRWTTMRENE